MKRLREIEAYSPLLQKAQLLIASTPPVPESAERMWRIRRELDRPRSAFGWLRRAPALAMAALVTLFGASAFAAVRLFEFARSHSSEVAAQPRASRLQPRTSARPLPRTAAASGVLEPTAPATVPGDTPATELTQPLTAAGAQPSLAEPSLMRERAQHVRSAPARLAARSHAGTNVHGRKSSHEHRTLNVSRPPANASRPPAGVAQAPEREVALAVVTDSHSAGANNQRTAQSSSAAAAEEASALRAARSSSATQATASVSAADVARAAAHPAPAVTRDSASVARGSELVHRALRALRRDHDPVLALRLLDRERASDPDGTLAEEALVLQIEATGLLRQARARTFAREYLERYPSGRYRGVAQRALQDAAP